MDEISTNILVIINFLKFLSNMYTKNYVQLLHLGEKVFCHLPSNHATFYHLLIFTAFTDFDFTVNSKTNERHVSANRTFFNL